MASRDREQVLKDYAARFDSCENEEALIEQLGTPTKTAIDLALRYTPTAGSPAGTPDAAAEPASPETPPAEELPLPETVSAAPAEPVPAPLPTARPAARKKRPVSPGGLILFLILLLLIGVPVTVAALSIGLPFLAGGAGLIAVAVPFVLRAIPVLKLIADLLLVFGSGLAASALGLLLAAFGLWLSIVLAWLWLGRVVLPRGRRLCRKKEVPQK